jgi:hypothetical protein
LTGTCTKEVVRKSRLHTTLMCLEFLFPRHGFHHSDDCPSGESNPRSDEILRKAGNVICCKNHVPESNTIFNHRELSFADAFDLERGLASMRVGLSYDTEIKHRNRGFSTVDGGMYFLPVM